MITGRRFEVPRFLQNALDRTPVKINLCYLYQSLLDTYASMEGFYHRQALLGDWDKRMVDQFLVTWETHYYDGYIDSNDDEVAAIQEWDEFQGFTSSFLDRDAERNSLKRLWSGIDRLVLPYNIISPYCLDDPPPTKEWFYVGDSEEV